MPKGQARKEVRAEDRVIDKPDAVERLEKLYQRLLRYASESRYGKVTLHFEAGLLVRITHEVSERAEDLD